MENPSEEQSKLELIAQVEDAARYAERQGNPLRAYQIRKRLQQELPERREPYNLAGEGALKAGLKENAAIEFRQSIRQNTNQSNTLKKLITLEKELRSEYPHIQEFYEELAEKAKNQSDIYNPLEHNLQKKLESLTKRALSAQDYGDQELRNNILTQIEQTDPTYQYANILIARQDIQHPNRINQTIETYLKAKKIDPTRPEPYEALFFYTKFTGYDETANKISRELENSGVTVPDYILGARVAVGLKKTTTALNLLEEANEAKKKTSGFHLTKGIIHFEREEFEKASQSLKKASELNPTRDTIYNLAKAQTNAGNHGEALQTARYLCSHFKEAPQNHTLNGLLAAITEKPLEAFHQYNQAINTIRQRLRRNKRELSEAEKSHHATAFLNRGVFLFEQGNPDDAKEDIEEALSIHPSPAAYFVKVEMMADDEEEKAKHTFQRMRERYPQHPLTYIAGSINDVLEGDYEKAIEGALKATDTHSQNSITDEYRNALLSTVLGKAMSHLSEDEIHHVIDSIISRQEEHAYSTDFAITFLDSLQPKTKYDRTAEKAFDILKRTPSIKESRLEDVSERFPITSRNEVRKFHFSEVGKNIYLGKRSKDGNNQRLEKELALNRFLRDNLASQGFEAPVPTPLGTMTFEGKEFLIQRFTNGVNLEDLLKRDVRDKGGEEPIPESFKAIMTQSAVKALGLLQAATYDHLKTTGGTIEAKGKKYGLRKNDRIEELQGRLITRTGETYEAQRFLRAYAETVGEEPTTEFLVHNDFSPANMLVRNNYHPAGGEFNITTQPMILDNENPVLGNPIKDTYTLFTTPEIIARSEKKEWEAISKMCVPAHAHLIGEKLIELTGNKYFANEEEVMNTLLETAWQENLQNTLCQIGSKLNQDKPEEAQWYLRHALNTMPDKLKDPFVKYIRSTGNDKLNEAL